MEPNDYEPVPPRQRKKPKVKESIIDHTYRDYSQVEVSSDDEAPSTVDIDKKSSRLQPNFPAKLHAIVSNPNYQHIICWQPHGRSWKIVDKHLLSTVICPKHFAHAKFESFNRSVNGWGFKRLLNPGPDCKSYYHECFLRGRPELTKLMQRLVNPGKRLPDKAGEPDFYEISRKYPLPAAPVLTPENMAVMSSPMGRGAVPGAVPGAGQAFFPGAPQAGGYPYGYYPAGPYPGQMPPPSPSTAAAAPGFGGGGQPGAAFPPQPPQGAYWPQQMGQMGQMPPGMYPPNPAAYGYYPYPQMMGAPPPQGYEQYPHPAMYGQYPPPGAPPPPASPGRAPGAQPAIAAAAATTADTTVAAPTQTADQKPGSQQTDKPAALATEANEQKEQKPPVEETPAEAGVKRPLEDSQADPADANPPPTKPTDSTAESSEKKAPVKSEEPAAAQQPTGSDAATPSAADPSASPKATAAPSAAPGKSASSEGEPKPGSGPSPKKGEGANEQQLLQDFFQQY